MPSPPQGVQTLILSSRTTVIVSWLPPEPRNGIVRQYLARILVASAEAVVNSQVLTIGTTNEEQAMVRSVTFGGLDLDNFRYQIEVYASTVVGQGPSSIPVFVGMDSGNEITTTEAIPVTTDVEEPEDTTSSVPVFQTTVPTSQPVVNQSNPATTSVSPTTTSRLPSVGETLPTPVMDAEYYIVRIVPPVIVVLFISVIIFAVAIGFCCHSRVNRQSKKGLYAFDASRDYALRYTIMSRNHSDCYAYLDTLHNFPHILYDVSTRALRIYYSLFRARLE